MSLHLDLEKASDAFTLCLEKAGILTVPHLEVGVGMDVSISFDDEHRRGVTDSLLTRIVPWGLTFDPDKKLEVFTFSDGASGVQEAGTIDASNYYGFVQKRIIGIKGYNGGTHYSHLIVRFLEHFGWTGSVVKKAGFLDRVMGKKDTVVGGERKRSLAIIITDGDNQDKDATRLQLRTAQERGDEVFFLFLGVSNQGVDFPFLEALNRDFKNVGYAKVGQLQKFVNLSDEAINEHLISEKLLTWLKA